MTVDELRTEFQTLVARYGLTTPTDLARLNLAEERRRYRIRHLETVIEEAQVEVGRLLGEIGGLEKGVRLALEDAISDARDRHHEGWSPVPVIGYRIWGVAADGVFGYRVRWESRRMSATCLQGMGDDEVPHTDGRCGVPACGIYTSKTPEAVIEAHNDLEPGWMIGMVDLSGKVVEHEHGYRAQHAEVTSVMGFDSEWAYVSDDAAEIDRLFEDPRSRVAMDRIPLPRSPAQACVAHFSTVNARRTTWT